MWAISGTLVFALVVFCFLPQCFASGSDRRSWLRRRQLEAKLVSRPNLSPECSIHHSVTEFRSTLLNSSNIQEDSFISTNSFRLAADIYFGPIDIYSVGDSNRYDRLHHKRLLNIIGGIQCLQPGVVIYVDTRWIQLFFSLWYPQLPVPIVLVSGGSDDSLPGGYIRFLLEANSKILHWYTMNCDQSSPRLSCIPLGLNDMTTWVAPDEFNRKWSSVERMVEIADQLVLSSRSSGLSQKRDLAYDVLIPRFNFGTHPSRMEAWHHFCGERIGNEAFVFTNTNNITALCGSKVETSDMYALTAKSAFVLSPHGHGLDCYRTWETLYLGAYPIVRRSTLDSLYEDLPVLIVNRWEDVTPALLARTYYEFSRRTFSYDRLKPLYWQQRFGSHGYPRYTYNLVDVVAESIIVLDKLGLKDNDLIKGSAKQVYWVYNSTKHAVQSAQVFFNRGWDFSWVKKVSDLDLSVIEDGPALTA